MDVRCSRAYLQETRIKTEDPTIVIQGLNTFLLCLHGMEEQELSVTFRSAAQHFESRSNPANLF